MSVRTSNPSRGDVRVRKSRRDPRFRAHGESTRRKILEKEFTVFVAGKPDFDTILSVDARVAPVDVPRR